MSDHQAQAQLTDKALRKQVGLTLIDFHGDGCSTSASAPQIVHDVDPIHFYTLTESRALQVAKPTPPTVGISR